MNTYLIATSKQFAQDEGNKYFQAYHHCWYNNCGPSDGNNRGTCWKEHGKQHPFGWRVEDKCHNQWIKVEIKVIATTTSSIQPTNG